jgi:hypothetical protein
MNPVTRRSFAIRMTTAVAGALAVRPACANEPQAQSPKPNQPPSENQPADEARRTSFEDHQLTRLLEAYPSPHLTDEMREGIRDGLAQNHAASILLRQIPLDFTIEPAFAFRVWRAN